MSENPKDASPQDASGTGAPPMPTGSEGSGESSAQGQEALNDALKRIDVLSKQIESIPELIDRRFKSGQDRNVSRLERDIGELKEIVEKSGGNFDLVSTDITIRDLQRQIDSFTGEATGSGVPSGSGIQDPEWLAAQGKVDAALQGAGISQDDPAYKSLVDRYRGKVNPGQFVEIVGTFVATRQRTASPAGVIPEGDFKPPDSDTTDALQKEYNERLAQIPQGDIRSLSNLKAEYRKKGLAVW